MAYILGQYNKNKETPDDDTFMTLVRSGTPKRRPSKGDSGISGVESIFYDECIQVENFSDVKNYYFHGKIKRIDNADQTFYIKLVYYSPASQEDDIEQYIKTITVSKGDPDDWVDVEFIFSPFLSFDCILFELQRSVADYRDEIRYPKIAYEELSIINNIINSKVSDGVKLIKIGVQSHPGLLMCINGEEVRTCRTGIYELKNGIMTVTFFSVVAGVKENTDIMEQWTRSVSLQIEEIDARRKAGEITAEEAEFEKSLIENRCFFNSEKQSRSIDSFTLDYMYREE